jgi:hypothetical protein
MTKKRKNKTNVNMSITVLRDENPTTEVSGAFFSENGDPPIKKTNFEKSMYIIFDISRISLKIVFENPIWKFHQNLAYDRFWCHNWSWSIMQFG